MSDDVEILARLNEFASVCDKTDFDEYGMLATDCFKAITLQLSQLATAQAEIERLRGALSNVRDDVGREAMNVIWRDTPCPETTFDYITSVIGDNLTYDEWDERQAPSAKEG